MKFALLLSSGFSISASAQKAPTFLPDSNPTPKGKSWELVENMSDEFDGDTLDLKKWQAKPRGNGWMWDGRPPGLFHERNVVVKDGKMNVTVSELEKLTPKWRYQGAIVRSLNAG